MIAAWMLYSLLAAVGLAAAAMLAERALFAGREPVRGVWVIAIGLSLIIPAAAHRFATIAAPNPTGATAGGSRYNAAVDSTFPASAAAQPGRQASGIGWSWRALPSRVDGPLTIVWLTLSAALLLHFLTGVIMLAWMRRSWRRDVVLGTDVLVSRSTGPALVGTISPAIVVPEWALAMDPPQLALMLRHEEEHRRARDGQLLTLAQCALIGMPWNLALWWQLSRLQLAVELDCDARVLRAADARSYGDLLLEVVRPRSSVTFLGATAFAERASHLEQRIRAIARPRGSVSRRMRAVAGAIGVAALAVGWVAPRPPVPAPAKQNAPPGSVSTDSLFEILFGGISLTAGQETQARALLVNLQTAQLAQTTNTQELLQESLPRRNVRLARFDSTLLALLTNAADVATLRSRLPQPIAPGGRIGELGAGYARLFDGITMSAAQEAAARTAILTLQQDVRALTQRPEPPIIGIRPVPRRVMLRPASDSALLALMSSDADRATLQSRINVVNLPSRPPMK